jgi:DNA-directed RNA polymerase subunit RPC12/RpoP
MCSTYVPFSLTHEGLERMAKESGMFYCMDCKKTFMMKGDKTDLKCPHCNSTRIKPRAK